MNNIKTIADFKRAMVPGTFWVSNITIYTNGMISVDGENTGLYVTQRKEGTILYRGEITPLSAKSLGCQPVSYKEFKLPSRRYSLNHPKPRSGNPGRLDFERDLLAILHAITKTNKGI